jgi:hypothetical protein
MSLRGAQRRSNLNCPESQRSLRYTAELVSPVFPAGILQGARGRAALGQGQEGPSFGANVIANQDDRGRCPRTPEIFHFEPIA